MTSKRLLFESNEVKTLKLKECDNVSIIVQSDKYKDYIGHKVATTSIKEGENIFKYGHPIGRATRFIIKGEHIHTHNVITNLSDEAAYEYNPSFELVNSVVSDKKFMGYKRHSGEVGIRNELWIIPTVACVNGMTDEIVKRFEKKHKVSENYDGVHTFRHTYGCSKMVKNYQSTKTILQNIIKHPNAGCVLVVGLDCESNRLDEFISTLGIKKNKIRYFNIDEVDDEFVVADQYLEELYQLMLTDNRISCSIADLRIGLECCSCDNFSGITANPLLGLVSDYVIQRGGTAVLTEVPEMLGAEESLLARCINKDVFLKTVDMFKEFKSYYKSHGNTIYEPPSFTSKDDGFTTLEDQALASVERSGHCPVVDVLKLNDRINANGLNLISAPQQDVTATTVLGTAGCQMVLLTTDRGMSFGGFIPTIKISTKTSVYNRKNSWIDFNAGTLIEGVSTEVLLNELINYILEVASGKWVNNEKNNFRDIGLFKSGLIS